MPLKNVIELILAVKASGFDQHGVERQGLGRLRLCAELGDQFASINSKIIISPLNVRVDILRIWPRQGPRIYEGGIGGIGARPIDKFEVQLFIVGGVSDGVMDGLLRESEACSAEEKTEVDI